jgi:hypothetical protein
MSFGGNTGRYFSHINVKEREERMGCEIKDWRKIKATETT